MRKNVFGRQFSRDTNERKALFKSLMSSLVLKDRIQTTVEKAKAIRPEMERLVTKAKKANAPQSYSDLHPYLTSDAVKKLVDDVAPRFLTRPGGYTRIIKIGNRLSDNATMAIIEWVEKEKALTVSSQTPVGPEKAAKKETKEEKQQAAPKKRVTSRTTRKTTKTKDTKIK